jgi:hypothetical protein
MCGAAEYSAKLLISKVLVSMKTAKALLDRIRLNCYSLAALIIFQSTPDTQGESNNETISAMPCKQDSMLPKSFLRSDTRNKYAHEIISELKPQ